MKLRRPDPSQQTRRTFLTASAAMMGLGGLELSGRESRRHESAQEANKTIDVVIYLYDRMTVLDAIGPYEVLRCMPGVRVRFAARQTGLVRPDSGVQMLNAGHSIADITSADILLVPGGDPSDQMKDKEVLDWIRRMNEKTRWTTSVCTGALVLGAAGLLKGLQATTYWNTAGALRMFGAEPVAKRYVQQGKIITAAGVSAGIDMALWLVARELGDEMAKTIQLLIEYDPQPPFNAGSPGKSSPAAIEAAKKMLAAIYFRGQR